MQTDNDNNLSNTEEFFKNSLAEKYESKAKRMIATTLDDGTKVIGNNKYQLLKKIPKENLTQEQLSKILIFEKYHGITESLQKVEKQKLESKKRLQQIQERKNKAKENINPDSVYRIFLQFFKKHEGLDFMVTPETQKNLEPLVYYFSKSEEFLKYGVKDEDGAFLSRPSLDKGLCIIGGYGNGKTSVMNTFQKMFIGLEDYSFGRFSSHDIIIKYEDANKHNHPDILENLWDLWTRSTLYIDDVKAEPQAFSYGKKNIINTLFLERYNKKKKTHISMNYTEGHNGKIKPALLELQSKYSLQFYDRVYEMFNIIEFKGKSFRGK